MKKGLSSSRQLAAIMFTDIVGYTKLMGENEEKAIQLLVNNRLIQKPLIKKYSGRWLKEIGDGTLSSFHSALDAVYCANKIMEAYKDVPDFGIRIGIHIGDVTFSEGDVFGDGVNIASRLEQHAQPNEILISEAVYQNIKNIEGIAVEFLKDVQLKNVNEPTRVFRVSEDLTEHVSDTVSRFSEYSEKTKKSPLKTAVILISLVLLFIVFYFFIYKKIPALESFGSEPPERTIAVVQFENLGEEGERAYSIGITEDIQFQLMKIHELTVIQQPRKLTGNPGEIDYKEIGIELGVANLLFGSVWKEGDQLRVTARLIDTGSGEMVWSDKWNKPFEDIFAIQSEVAVSIANALKAKISTEEVAQIEKRPTFNMTAYELYLKGREYYSRYTEKDNLNAMELFMQSLQLDPQFAMAHAGLSDAFSQQAQRSHIKEFWLDSAYHHALIATQNEPGLSSGHKALGLYYSIIGNTEEAQESLSKAVELDNNVDAVINLSRIYYRIGRMDQSLEVLNNARNQHPLNENILFNYGATYYRLNDFQRANEFLDQALVINPGHINSLLLKWFIAVISGDVENSFSTSSKLGYFGNDKIDDVLNLLQNKISENIQDKAISAQALNQLLEDREVDYIDIPYIYMLICQIYYEGDLQKKAMDLFDYKILYNEERIAQGEKSYKFYYELAQIFAIKGDKEKAYEYLKSSVDLGWPEYLYGLLDPSFSSIANEERFQDLIKSSRERVSSIQNSIAQTEKQRIG